MNIMIVDDSRTMRKIVRNGLESMGYAPDVITEASDGTDALKLLHEMEYRFDLVLADWNMPEMDGLELLKEMQSSEAMRGIPVIMVTGEAQRNNVVDAIKSGARGYIVKPFENKTLREKVLAVEQERIADSKPTETARVRMLSVRQEASQSGRVPFLRQLPEELEAGIREKAEISTHAAGSILVQIGDRVQGLCIITSGEAELISNDGKQIEVRRRGDCYGEVSFLSSESSLVEVRARKDMAVARVGKADFEVLLSEHPHLSFYLTRLLALQAAGGDEPQVDRGLSGQLSTMSLPELVQTLSAGKKTGALMLKASDASGEILFRDGDVCDAHAGNMAGEEGFYELLTWREGSFSFRADVQDRKPVIFRATMSLLMEGMRRLDETKRSGSDVPVANGA